MKRKVIKKKKPVRNYAVPISSVASVRAKGKHKKVEFKSGISHVNKESWMVVGVDTSFSSLAYAAVGWDATLKQMRGPEFLMNRWTKDDHYYDRLVEAANSHKHILELQAQLKMTLGVDQVFIAQEEPVPLRQAMQGSWTKQQIEISGAFLGGLLRYGFQHVSQIGSIQWRKMVADELTFWGMAKGGEITTHHTKWKNAELALYYNAKPDDSGKFRAQEWAEGVLAPWMASRFKPGVIPDFAPIIKTKDGKQPRPADSHAKAEQSDDRYEALAVMMHELREILRNGFVHNPDLISFGDEV